MSSRPPPRPDLEELTPYRTQSAPSGVRLHANENPYAPPDDVMAEIAAEVRRLSLNRYPDIAGDTVRGALAAYAEVDPDWVWVGDGSNEVLLQACLAYGGPGRTALVFEPTYRMHHRQARIAGTSVEVAWRRPDFTVDLDGAVRDIRRLRPDVVFVCTPNNPTGTSTPPGDLVRLAEAAVGLVLVDEAYYEFSGATFVPRLAEFANVIVVRTMSKAFRLAGVRVGYGIAQPETLEPLRKVRMPYAQSAPALAAAAVALRRRAEMLARIPDIVIERERLSLELGKLPGVEVFPSEANFVLFRHQEAEKIAAALAEAGILVREFSGLPGCESCLRVTAGTPAENDAFLGAIAHIV